MNRRHAALVATVVSLLALALARAGGGGPPLYDGICLPPHYLLFGANPGPPSAGQTFTAGDLSGSFQLADNPSTPQAQIIVGAGSLAPTPGSSTVTLTITPVAPPATKPSDGTIDGNVYSFTAMSGAQVVALQPGHPATVVLGATSSGGSQLALERFSGTRWVPVGKTFQSGCGTTYEAASQALGLFALVSQGPPAGNRGAASQGGGTPVVLIVVVVLVALALIVGSVRLTRRRR